MFYFFLTKRRFIGIKIMNFSKFILLTCRGPLKRCLAGLLDSEKAIECNTKNQWNSSSYTITKWWRKHTFGKAKIERVCWFGKFILEWIKFSNAWWKWISWIIDGVCIFVGVIWARKRGGCVRKWKTYCYCTKNCYPNILYHKELENWIPYHRLFVINLVVFHECHCYLVRIFVCLL